MAYKYIKKAAKTPETDDHKTQAAVQDILNDIAKRKEVLEKFGVKPNQVIDVQSLAGDSSDNIPGVPGIGVKTASQLITEYGSLEKLLDNASSIKQEERRESLLNNAELAIVSKKLVSLFSNTSLNFSY